MAESSGAALQFLAKEYEGGWHLVLPRHFNSWRPSTQSFAAHAHQLDITDNERRHYHAVATRTGGTVRFTMVDTARSQPKLPNNYNALRSRLFVKWSLYEQLILPGSATIKTNNLQSAAGLTAANPQATRAGVQLHNHSRFNQTKTRDSAYSSPKNLSLSIFNAATRLIVLPAGFASCLHLVSPQDVPYGALVIN
jgi:hypothetical protein